jgi:hypothetical protein
MPYQNFNQSLVSPCSGVMEHRFVSIVTMIDLGASLKENLSDVCLGSRVRRLEYVKARAIIIAQIVPAACKLVVVGKIAVSGSFNVIIIVCSQRYVLFGESAPRM